MGRFSIGYQTGLLKDFKTLVAKADEAMYIDKQRRKSISWFLKIFSFFGRLPIFTKTEIFFFNHLVNELKLITVL